MPPRPIHRRSLKAAAVALLVAVVVIGAALGMGGAGAAGPAPPSLRDAIDSVTSQARYANTTFGFQVRDRDTGEVLFDQNGNLMFVTGSILKVFSNATALDSYGPDYRFRTPVYRTGAVREGRLRGDLVLVGSGDLSLGLREKPDGTMVYNSAPQFDHTYANASPGAVPVDGDPLAGLDSLARQVADSGIHRVRGDVVIDDRLFDTFFGWPDAAVSPMTPIWVNENRIDITSTPTAVGQRAALDFRPKTAAYTVRTEVTTGPAGSETNIAVSRPEPGVFLVSGTIAADAGPILRVGEIPDPAAFARTAFIEALERAGVTVDAPATGPNPSKRLPPEGSLSKSERVAEHVSAPLSQFTKVILHTSHNPGGDLMACLDAVAAGSKDCRDGLVAEAAYAKRVGVPDDQLFIFDGAGSDERDHVTSTAMTSFLRGLDGQAIGPAFERSLSLLGVDGSIADAIPANSPAAGKVRAKDGTRAAVAPNGVGILTARNLIGYADAKSGRRIVLTVMFNNVPFHSFDDVIAIVNDNAEIAAAMQQAF
jgi:D-alanyl-D-alanine carboxypeptidase/D-alanyl-D-alanine-endopeptidase (penicillin-binding protein 4)